MMQTLDDYTVIELLQLQTECYAKLVSTLCQLITSEIDNRGTKKRVRAWLKSLREIHKELMQSESLDQETASILNSVEIEAAAYLFNPK